MGAALYHGLIRRDGVFSSMARGAAAAEPDDESPSIEALKSDADASSLPS
jgi:hypothetical protein